MNKGQTALETLIIYGIIILVIIIAIGITHNYFYSLFCPKDAIVCTGSTNGFFEFISWTGAIIIVGGIADVVLYCFGLSPGVFVVAIIKGFFGLLSAIFGSGRRG